MILRCLFLLPLLSFAQSEYEKELTKGIDYLNSGQAALAVDSIQRAVNADPSSKTALAHLANARMGLYLWLEQPSAVRTSVGQQAIHAWRLYLEKDPSSELALWGMAVAHTFAGNPEEAWNWCQRLLKANPESREANYLQGSLAWMLSFRAEQQGRMKAGIEESNKGPLPDETLRQSLRLSEGERLRTALSGLEKLLRGDPDHADAMEYAGMILRQQASLAESEVEFARLYRQFESRVQQADRMRVRKEPARLPVYKAGELPPPFPAPSTPPERIRETLSR